MSQQPFDPQPSQPPALFAPPPAPRAVPLGLFVAALAVTAVMAAGLVLLGARWVLGADRGAVTPRPVARAAVVAAKVPAVNSARLLVREPRRLLDTGTGRSMTAGSERDLRLPTLGRSTTAVLLQLSIIDSGGAGLVTVSSAVDDIPALRVGAAGGQTTATVVAVLGADRSLRVHSDVSGRLVADLVGTFEASRRSAAGRLVATRPATVVDIRPVDSGHDATVDLRKIAALRDAGQPSAVVLRVAGDVGAHGGSLTVGDRRDDLHQKVFWSATAGADRLRNGLLVVPTPARKLYLHYKAGFRLRVELVGYVTGKDDDVTGAGLSVPLRQQQAAAVRVDISGRTDVKLIPGQGIAGVAPNRIAAILAYVSATGKAPGAVSVQRPGSRSTSVPDLSPGRRARSALALTGLTDGRVTLTSRSDAVVILTPRLLILR